MWSKRKKQVSAGTEATHEAEGAKTRGAVQTSYEITHDLDPLYPTVDGDAKKRAPDDNDGLAYEATDGAGKCEEHERKPSVQVNTPFRESRNRPESMIQHPWPWLRLL